MVPAAALLATVLLKRLHYKEPPLSHSSKCWGDKNANFFPSSHCFVNCHPRNSMQGLAECVLISQLGRQLFLMQSLYVLHTRRKRSCSPKMSEKRGKINKSALLCFMMDKSQHMNLPVEELSV